MNFVDVDASWDLVVTGTPPQPGFSFRTQRAPHLMHVYLVPQSGDTPLRWSTFISSRADMKKWLSLASSPAGLGLVRSFYRSDVTFLDSAAVPSVGKPVTFYHQEEPVPSQEEVLFVKRGMQRRSIEFEDGYKKHTVLYGKHFFTDAEDELCHYVVDYTHSEQALFRATTRKENDCDSALEYLFDHRSYTPLTSHYIGSGKAFRRLDTLTAKKGNFPFFRSGHMHFLGKIVQKERPLYSFPLRITNLARP